MEGWKEMRGQLGRDLASIKLAGPGALKQWVASKQQAADMEHGLTDALFFSILCLRKCLCTLSFLLLVSDSVQRP